MEGTLTCWIFPTRESGGARDSIQSRPLGGVGGVSMAESLGGGPGGGPRGVGAGSGGPLSAKELFAWWAIPLN